MLFDQVHVIISAVEPENKHLVAPFHYRSLLLHWNQTGVFWHEFFSHNSLNVPPVPLQLNHELLDQLYWVCIVDMRGLQAHACFHM